MSTIFTDHANTLSRFLLSLIFVIVCGHIELKWICLSFSLFMFISVLSLLKWGWDTINLFNPVTFMCLSQARPWISISICHCILACSMIWGNTVRIMLLQLLPLLQPFVIFLQATMACNWQLIILLIKLELYINLILILLIFFIKNKTNAL